VISDDGETWQESCTLLPTYARGQGISAGYPADPSIWIGSYGSGLYRSDDGGETWSVLGDDLTRLFVIDFAASPGYPADPTLLMSANRRLMLSGDQGTSWNQVDTSCVHAIERIVFSPGFDVDGRGYVVGTTESSSESAVARSEDGGASWECVWASDGASAPQVRGITFSAVESVATYGMQSSPAAVLRATEDGESWDVLASFPTDTELAALFALAHDGDEVLLAVADDGRTWRGIGAEWTEGAVVDEEVLRGHAFVPAGERSPRSLYLSTLPSGLLHSDDGGDSWEDVDADFGSPVLEMAFPPSQDTSRLSLASTHFGSFFRCADDEPWQLLDRMMRLEEDSCPLRYAGSGWESGEDGGTGHSYRTSSTPGDRAEITVSCSEIRWLAAGEGETGRANVFVDDENLGEVDLTQVSSPDRIAFAHAFEVEGEHTLGIEVVGGGAVTLDAIEVVRQVVANGSSRVYEAAQWCDDLSGMGDPVVPSDGGCCGGARESSAGAPSAGLVLALFAGLAHRRRAYVDTRVSAPAAAQSNDSNQSK